MEPVSLEEIQKRMQAITVKPTPTERVIDPTTHDMTRGDNPTGSISLDRVKAAQEKQKEYDSKRVAPGSKSMMDEFTRERLTTENSQLAGSQRTTPIMSSHAPNFLGEAYEDDAGNAQFMDPVTGTLKPTNHREHVLLQDPEDGKFKVYKRTKDTDTNMLAAIGHIVLPGLVTSNAPRAAKAAGSAVETLGAINRLEDATGVRVPVSRAAASDSSAAHAGARAVSHLPGGAGPLEDAARGMAGQSGEAAERIAGMNTSGRVVSAEQAGGVAAKGLMDEIKPGGVLSQKVKEAYDKVDALMPPEHLAKTSKMENTSRVGWEIQREFASTKKEGLDPAFNQVIEAVISPEGLTYHGVKRLRTMIGEMIDTGKIPEGVSNGHLKRLYGALTDDLREIIKQRRVDGAVPLDAQRRLQLWERANTMAKAASERREKLVSILGANNKSDEAIFHSILRLASDKSTANAKLLDLARKSMPKDAWDEITSAAIGRMGRRVTDAGEHFDPGKFLRDYTNMSQRGKDILFGKSTPHRQALDDLAKISTRWDTALELSHKTGEFGHLGMAVGVVHKPTEMMGAILGFRLLSRAFAKPVTAKSIAKWADRYTNIVLAPRSPKGGTGFLSWTPAQRRVLFQATEHLAASLGRDPDTAEEAMKDMAGAGKKGFTAAAITSHIFKKLWGEVEGQR